MDDEEVSLTTNRQHGMTAQKKVVSGQLGNDNLDLERQ